MDRGQTGDLEPVAPLAAVQDRLRIVDPDPVGIAAGSIDGRRQVAPKIERATCTSRRGRGAPVDSATTAVITIGPRLGP